MCTGFAQDVWKAVGVVCVCVLGGWGITTYRHNDNRDYNGRRQPPNPFGATHGVLDQLKTETTLARTVKNQKVESTSQPLVVCVRVCVRVYVLSLVVSTSKCGATSLCCSGTLHS